MMAYLRNAKATGFYTVAVFATADWMMVDGRTNRNGGAPFIADQPDQLNLETPMLLSPPAVFLGHSPRTRSLTVTHKCSLKVVNFKCR